MPRILFYYFLFSTVLVTPFALIDWKPFGFRASIYLIGIGLTLFVGQVLIVLAYRYASAFKVGPFIYTVIIFTAIVDWVLWDRAPTLLVLLGMALAIGGVKPDHGSESTFGIGLLPTASTIGWAAPTIRLRCEFCKASPSADSGVGHRCC